MSGPPNRESSMLLNSIVSVVKTNHLGHWHMNVWFVCGISHSSWHYCRRERSTRMPLTAVSRSYQCRTRPLLRVLVPRSSSMKIETPEATILWQVFSKTVAYACNIGWGTGYELSGTSTSDDVAYPATKVPPRQGTTSPGMVLPSSTSLFKSTTQAWKDIDTDTTPPKPPLSRAPGALFQCAFILGLLPSVRHGLARRATEVATNFCTQRRNWTPQNR